MPVSTIARAADPATLPAAEKSDLRLSVACAVAREAGALARRRFDGRPGTSGINLKGNQDYLSAVDAEVEGLLRRRLLESFPEDSFFGEEGGGSFDNDVWVVDPIDGTANFVRGISQFCISIAYVRGGQTQIAIINPATVLVTPADLDGLDWVQTHLPAEAVVLINGWEWLNGTWAGSDGGAWIWPLTGRRTTIPPADYAYASAAWQKEVNDFNAQAAQIVEADAPETLALLRGAGVTHVFIGARGGTLKPEMFMGKRNYSLLYSNGSDWIFSLKAA